MIGQDRDHSQGLSATDARAMLQLGATLHRAPREPALRKRLLLEGLCRLLSADSARTVVTRFDTAAGRHVVVSEAAYVADATTGQAASENGAPLEKVAGSPAGIAAGPPAVLPQSIDSFVDLSGLQVVATLTVTRRAAGGRFTRRDREVVEVLHSESAWVYGHDLLGVSPEVLALTPREQETLRQLAAGRIERQIAYKLNISTNTVHHYVKSLYRRFGASSRDELLSRWVH